MNDTPKGLELAFASATRWLDSPDTMPLDARGSLAVLRKRLGGPVPAAGRSPHDVINTSEDIPTSSPVFKRSTGVPVHEYVVQRRVERAKALLMRGELPASQLALEAGFAHQSHMARAMRRLLGVTPTALARRL